MENKILLGMSGGVDSSVAAKLLINSGFNTVGATLKLCPNEDDTATADAKAVCDKLNIPHYSFNLQNEFNEYVIEAFIKSYLEGLTPNPCIECNRHIKFGEMFNIANSLGIEKLATGHYADTVKCGDRYLIKKAKDAQKDQSYVLYMLKSEQIKNIVFPLGKLTKNEVREIAAENGFINANKKDSQDICFVENGKYAEFVANRHGTSYPGDFIDVNGNFLGRNEGVIHYTIGQRKGLKVSFGVPMFVVNKNAENNTVTLGTNEDLYTNIVYFKNASFAAFDNLESQLKVIAKLRYSAKEQPATLERVEENKYMLKFPDPVRAVTPGQFAVIYDGDTLLGGGEII